MTIKNYLKKSFFIVLIITCLLSISVPAYAQADKINNCGLNDNAIEFLEEHNVDLSIYESSLNANAASLDAGPMSLDESILSLEQEAAAYNFTDDQIQKYVDGLVNNPTTVSSSNSVRNSTPYSTNRPYDKGIGYEVKSNSGYYQETAFATLPSVYKNGVDKTSGYLFYTIASYDESYGSDVGLWYSDGDGGIGWRGCYDCIATQGVISELSAGSQVYLQAYLTTNGYIRCRVLDANDFSTVYYDVSNWVGSNISRSSAIIDRQITLCNGDKDFTTGEYLHNGQFSNAYIYSTDGYSPVNSSNTNSAYCGVFGTDEDDKELVSVNDHEEWDSENISIDFDL